jgi:hypothetical protein
MNLALGHQHSQGNIKTMAGSRRSIHHQSQAFIKPSQGFVSVKNYNSKREKGEKENSQSVTRHQNFMSQSQSQVFLPTKKEDHVKDSKKVKRSNLPGAVQSQVITNYQTVVPNSARGAREITKTFGLG